MNPKEQILLEKLLDDPVFNYLKLIVEEMKTNWRSVSSVKDTEFNTVKATIEKEAKCGALDALVSNIENRYANRPNEN